MTHPNIIFIFGDQWRYQALGFAGNPDVQTPNIDRLAAQSLNFTNAISGCPVCCPARASLLTGQYPDRHGVFVNDVHLSDDADSLAKVCKAGGYDTAWIGKWHIDGMGRANFTPPARRQGFDHWLALECTHSYNDSLYYAGDDPTPRKWPEYDAIPQTRAAQEYISNHANGDPFLLVLSWGPPHNPYETAPAQYRAMYDPAKLTLPPNVPPEKAAIAREEIAGYYAHCTALDDLVGDLLQTVDDAGIADLLADFSDLAFTKGGHGPVTAAAGDVMDKIADDGRAALSMHDLRVELNAIEATLLIGNRGKGRAG